MSSIPEMNQIIWTRVLKFVRDEKQRSWILLCPASLGDTWAVCALAKAFKETHGGPLTMVIKPEHGPIAQMYHQHIDRIIGLENLPAVSLNIQRMMTFDIDQPIVAHPFWHGDGRLIDIAQLYHYPGRGGIGFTDWFRHILRLSWDSRLEMPVIPEPWKQEALAYAHDLGMVEGNSVILFPNNNSAKEFPDYIWQALADRLIEKGKIVFTNLAGNLKGPRQAPFVGTKGINVSLTAALPLAEYAGQIIGGSNGLFCMAAGSLINCDITVLIHVPPEGEVFDINGFTFAPISIQSVRLQNWPPSWPRSLREYPLSPHGDFQTVLEDIANGRLESALRW